MSKQRSGRSTEIKEVKVYFGLIELLVSGDYNEGDNGDMWTPPTGGELEQVKIMYNDIDVNELLYELLPSKQYEEIINKAIEQIESDL